MTNFSRRNFLKTTAATGAFTLAGGLGMPFISRAADRPMITHGLQSGDVGMNNAIIWARADRPSRMLVDLATDQSFANAVRQPFADALPTRDLAAKLDLKGLEAGQDYYYRVRFQDLGDINVTGQEMVGHFRTAPANKRDITFLWSGDTAGQGWGIDESRGGMKIYNTMAKYNPDFMIHSGDTVYCDGPMKETVTLKDGTEWKNLLVEEKSKVAESLNEFRGNWKYNMLDSNVRAFNQTVPVFYQWDDHEVLNNWYPGEMLHHDERYKVKSASLLAARANRAFLEMSPIRENAREPGRIYRKVSYGPLLDVFFIDMRTYRGPNGVNNQDTMSRETAFLGKQQIEWLKREMLNSKATWKVIASDMPIGLIVYDDWKTKGTFENMANGDGHPKGRELEFAALLSFIRHADIRNVVWLTADVHYTAAHYYDPNKAEFKDFAPFWEFVSGPLHAGTFGPNPLDNTFGPQLKYVKAPTKEQGINLPPSLGLQFFGHVKINGESEQMTVTLKDTADTDLYAVTLTPAKQA